LLVLVGVSVEETEKDVIYVAEKIVSLRIFDDHSGVMNLSVIDIAGQILAVSQFTLYGDVRRGRRPSWRDAAPPAIAEMIYDSFVAQLRQLIPRVATGRFRSAMKVELVNDGPVTILVDSRKQF
jgi:D-tyrosyl-tRNA(Tyr) deacylase